MATFFVMVQRYVNSKFGDVETATAPTLIPTVIVSFNSSDIHHPVSTQDFEFIMKLNEQLLNFEFVKRPAESNLSIYYMLDVVTSWQNIMRGTRLLKFTMVHHYKHWPIFY